MMASSIRLSAHHHPPVRIIRLAMIMTTTLRDLARIMREESRLGTVA
jgi:hypothetical protein